MTELGWRIQISPKLTDGTLVNLRAETPAEAEQILDWAIANAAKIGDAVKAVNAVSVVGAAFPGAQVSVEQDGGASAAGHHQTPPPAAAGWNTSAATPPPAFAQQPQQHYAQAATAQAPAPAAAPPAQHCVHGAMTYREGTSKAGKPYRAFFCPTPKGTVGQCQPEFLR